MYILHGHVRHGVYHDTNHDLACQFSLRSILNYINTTILNMFTDYLPQLVSMNMSIHPDMSIIFFSKSDSKLTLFSNDPSSYISSFLKSSFHEILGCRIHFLIFHFFQGPHSTIISPGSIFLGTMLPHAFIGNNSPGSFIPRIHFPGVYFPWNHSYRVLS